MGLTDSLQNLFPALRSAKDDLVQRMRGLENRINALDVRAYALSALNATEPGVTERAEGPRLTVTLTSYGERALDVYLVIESLMQQSVRADRIVLWLSEDEFDRDSLPELLERQENRGLVVRFTEDLRSYKKLIPALTAYPDDLLLTVDDDVLFPVDHIERLYRAHRAEPEVIHCYRGHRMTYAGPGHLKPYREWELETDLPHASLDVFPVGVGGVLYFPGCFDEEVTHRAAFTSLCPDADDIWFKAMSRRRGTACRVVPHARSRRQYHVLPGTQADGLWKANSRNNDRQLRAVLEAYPDLGLRL